MSSEQKDYKTEIINCFKSLAPCVVPANRSMLRWQNEVIHAVISEHITRMRWRWYLYWHSYHAFFNKNVILWPYSDSSAVEVRSLRSGLHKWEFTHAQLTDVALWIDTSMIWVKLPYPLPLTSFLFYSILSMQPGNRDDNSDLQEWTLAAVWNVYPDCCVVSPSRLQNQHELHDLMVLITSPTETEQTVILHPVPHELQHCSGVIYPSTQRKDTRSFTSQIPLCSCTEKGT